MSARFSIGVFLAAIVIVPFCAIAQDMTPISDRILSDPTFLPLKGQIYGETSYDYTHGDATNYNDDGGYASSVSRHLNTIRQYFAYGITDELSVDVSEAYGFAGQASTTTLRGVSVTNQSGFEDPIIGATYRLVDQRSHPFSLDAFAHYSPDAFTAKSATDFSDGSVASGGQQVDFGLAVGHETRFLTIRGSVTATYLGNASLQNSLTGAYANTSGYWAPALGIQTQTRVTDRLSLNLAGAYTFNGSPTVTNSVSGIQRIEDLGDHESINVGLNYHFVPNRLVGSLGYTHTFYDRSNFIYASDPALDTSHARSADGAAVTLRYVFK